MTLEWQYILRYDVKKIGKNNIDKMDINKDLLSKIYKELLKPNMIRQVQTILFKIGKVLKQIFLKGRHTNSMESL